jgi:outer membrane protein OmpA-like peptidoglycan-associated protein/Tol biopolymer transport system component
MVKQVLISTVFLFIGLSLQAQTIKQYVEAGDKFHSRKNYKEAIASFKKALEMNPDDASVNFKLGLSYLYSDTKSKAASFIDKAYRLNPNIDNRIDYHLGIAFQNTNDFKKAIEHFEFFKKKNPNVGTIADERIAECLVADSLMQFELNVVIENLGLTVNSEISEYSPLISSDGKMLIFTSNRDAGPKGERLEKIYVSYRDSKGWSQPKKLSENLNTPDYNDAAASLSPDGKTLFLYSEEGAGDIYTSTFDGKDWGKPVPLNKNINTAQYWETCASISPDGKKLYFASNRPDGYGELDIYVSELDSKGQWGKAVNLGPNVNTPGNDDSPYIHYDGVTLYFSSDGHPKLGNSDILVTEFKNGKWTKPENIGYPINSWEYDGFFSISPDKKTAYYATVKEGGNGAADIYSIKFLEPKYKPKPKPVVVEAPKKKEKKNDDYVDPLIKSLRDQKVVTILRGKVIDETDAKPLEATITLVNNETGKVMTKLTSDPETGDFELTIPHGSNYGVSSEKAGYLFTSFNFNMPKDFEYQEIDTHIIMPRAEVGSKVILRNVFFDVGKADLKPQSIAEVEKIISLLAANPELKVQINGHTDNTGNPASNKTLSLKRATSVVDYLISKGIEASRVTAKGYGSERPIVSNDEEVGGRELNRRSEIEIIEANK